MKKNLVLVGMMAVGKTTLAQDCGKKAYNLKFVDTDAQVLKRKNSMSIAEIFEKKGENFFRKEGRKRSFKIFKRQQLCYCFGWRSVYEQNSQGKYFEKFYIDLVEC